jgi:hypothetical protein
MGSVTKFITKIGVVGSTARWAAKHFLRLSKSDRSRIDVMREMIEFRYKILDVNNAKQELIERMSYLDNLTDFTFSILQLEGAIITKEMPMGLQLEVTTVIMEELRKKGVPEIAIVGEKTI